MEDGTIAVENMVFRGGKEKEEDKRVEANGRGGGGGGGGEERANSFISNLVSAEDGKVEGKDEEKGTGEGGGGGGVIAHFISNLVSPLSSPRDGGELKKRKVDLFDVEIEGRSEDGVSSISPEEDGGGVNGGGGGGTISNLISNFFHQSEGEGGEKDEHGKDEVKVVVGESKQVKTEEDGGSGGGIISNLVSHLPTSLPDDAAPAPDEAAILIHSIVRD